MPSANKMLSWCGRWIGVFIVASIVIYFGNLTNVVSSWITLKLASVRIIPILKIIQHNMTLRREHYKDTLNLPQEMIQIKKWCRPLKWQDMYEPCRFAHKWSDKVKDIRLRTNVSMSRYELQIKPLGFSNRLVIHSHDSLGRRKYKRGDFWRVHIIGKNYSSAFHLRDEGHGVYEGGFVMKEEGDFKMVCYLEYSLCDGVRDPPPDWFRRGTIQGKFQDQRILGKLDDYLNIPSRRISFRVSRFMKTPLPLFKVLDGCTLGQNHCGYWTKGRYLNNMGENKIMDIYTQKITPKNYSIRNRTLFIYGDSMAKRFHGSINRTSDTCRKVFSSCDLSYIWVYKQDGVKDAHVYDGKDFNQSRFLQDIKEDILRPSMRTKNSYLVINFGLHVLMALSFKQAQSVFQAFLAMLKDMRRRYGNETLPTVIWKTTTPPRPEAHELNIAHLRFLTKQRMYLWNSYTIEEACKANIPVIDVYNMALSNIYGGLDIVHYKDEVFKKAEEDLLQFTGRRSV